MNYCLALSAGILYFLGFAGIDFWPCAMLAYVPIQLALERVPVARPKDTIKLGLLFGFVAMFGGYYWLIHVLREFSGFPLPICVALASLLVLQQAGAFGLFAYIWWLGRRCEVNLTLRLVVAATCAEFIYPMLFPYYYGASFHTIPVLLQTAELGGPLLVSALCFVINGTIFEAWHARYVSRTSPRRALTVGGAVVLAVTVFGIVRMQQVDSRAKQAPKISVGLVQANMDTFGKRDDPIEGLRRHLRLSRDLERNGTQPGLIVWPESSYAWALPEGLKNVRRAVTGSLSTPILFGAISRRNGSSVPKIFNTAFITDAEGNIQGSYDKTYLLAFGEYLPFGDLFPVLYEWSPNSGHFSKGAHVNALPLGKWRIGTLICYEDILPAFVRKVVRHSDPHFLVNITNDSWFGDTTEPWEHLALSKLRSVEHRRFLLRATNSGVSAIIDPVGRVVDQTKLFREQTLQGEVSMLKGQTFYSLTGDWPGWLSLALSGWWLLCLLRRRSVHKRGKQ
ncbi:MAG: apolipoprotein N-acyltransferase [Myxococcales bacterium]|nr:apolipoprotein N-acyltransferase [Myxococcales bacterium]MCB9707383.1 apolipoprotein N-acyltransferase [Myxococcales bacterium]